MVGIISGRECFTRMRVFKRYLCKQTSTQDLKGRANGLRYPLVGGTRQRHFDGIQLEAKKLLENAQTPTSRVHAVLGKLTERKTFHLKRANQILLIQHRVFCTCR